MDLLVVPGEFISYPVILDRYIIHSSEAKWKICQIKFMDHKILKKYVAVHTN